MRTRRAQYVMIGGVLAASAIALAPAIGASADLKLVKPRVSLSARGGLGSFTPAAADPRLAALLARSGLASNGFRFTPASASMRINRSVTVAVRARTDGATLGGERTALVAAPNVQLGATPAAYDLGVALGWRRFALSGDMTRVDIGAIGGREAVDVGLSYNTRRWSGRVAVGADRPTAGAARALTGGEGYSVDVGGSYRLTRRIDLTAGVRYRTPVERDRLVAADDNRRDSQAVYVGTAFKF